MKTSFSILALSLTLFFTACEKESTAPQDTCKLSIIDRGNGNRHTYAYGADGKISSMTREFDGNGSGNISKYLFTFEYNTSGLLSKSTILLDGMPSSVETYTWTDGKISKVAFKSVDGSSGVNNIKYNTAGYILEFTYEPDDKSYFDIQYFEYDANNIFVKHGFKSKEGNIYFENRIKPTGVVKSPEQLLVARGLPFDILTGSSWSNNMGGEGTLSEVFYPNSSGVLEPAGIDKTTALKVDTKGYITEISYLTADNSTLKGIFSLVDCN